jgi:hypothetical protein
MKPAIQFLEHIATNPEKIFDNYINKELNRRNKTIPVNGYVCNNYDVVDDDKSDDNKSHDNTENKHNLSKVDIKKIMNKTQNETKIVSEDRLINKIKTNVKQSLTINI